MRLPAITLSAFITGFSGAAMPGPVLAAAIPLAATLGFVSGPLIVLGHFLLEVCLVLALAAGLGRYLNRADAPLVRAIGLLGGLALLVMAAMMARDLPTLSLQSASTATPGTANPVLAGLLTSASNPYFWFWWATIGLGLLTEAMAQRGKAGLAAFYTGHIVSDLVWYSLIAALVSGGRSLFGDGAYRALIGVCAAALLYFGLRFLRLSLRPPVAVAA